MRKRPCSSFCCGSVFAAVLLLIPAAPDRAEADAAASRSEFEARATEALERGRSQLGGGDFLGAARSFEQAYRLAPPDSTLAFDADTEWHETLPRAMARVLIARGEAEQALRLVDDALAATADHPRHREVLNGLRSSVVALQKATAPPVDERKYSKLAAQALDEFRRREGRYPAGIPETREALARAGVLEHYQIVNYFSVGAGYQLELRGRNPAGGKINLRATGLMQ